MITGEHLGLDMCEISKKAHAFPLRDGVRLSSYAAFVGMMCLTSENVCSTLVWTRSATS